MPQTTRKPRPRGAAWGTRRRAAPPQVTIEITEVETLPPHQQAAWDWFAAQVRARIARRRQQESEGSDADARP